MSTITRQTTSALLDAFERVRADDTGVDFNDPNVNEFYQDTLMTVVIEPIPH